MAVLTKMIGFVSTSDPRRARSFYEGVLGFGFLSEDDYGLVFDANGTKIRVAKGRKDPPAPGTVLGWEVEDIHGAIRALVARGVKFEQWNLPFMKQDPDGVWMPGNGDEVAWFKDPDGNVLSISRHARKPQ